MKPSKIPATLVLLVLFAASVSLGATGGHAQPLDSVTGDSARVIVKLRTDSPLMREKAIAARPGEATRAKALGWRIGLALGEGPAVSEHAQVVVATGLTSAQLAEQLARESDVEFAVPDRRRHVLVAPNDPLYESGVPGNGPFVGQWYLRAPDAEVRSSLNVEPAWAITTGDPSLVVAVVDTGVRYEHPDLLAVSAGGNLLPGYDMISDPGPANDGDGRDADASDPGDWVTQAELSQRGPFFECMQSPRNSSWHGTRVSSLIATLTDNGIGMASVGRNVRLLPVRALGKCGGFDSDIIAAMRWAAGLAVPGAPSNPHPARVINLSFGEAGACGAVYRQTVSEINARGAVIVAAAGNSAGHAVITPANCPGIIAVAGLRHVGSKVGFSDLGPEIAIAAPGGNCVNVAAGSPCLYSIIAATNSGLTTPVSPTYTDSFNRSVGTSFASPLVAGTAALMLSAQPSLTPERVSVLLRSTARPFPTTGGDLGAATPVCRPPLFTPTGEPIDQLECYCTTGTCGAGILDAGAAVSAASANRKSFPGGRDVVERARRLRIGMGHQLRAPGRHRVRHVVHLRFVGQGVVAVDDRAQGRRQRVFRNAVRDARSAFRLGAVRSRLRRSNGRRRRDARLQRREQRHVQLHGERRDTNEEHHAPGVRRAADVHVRSAARTSRWRPTTRTCGGTRPRAPNRAGGSI